MPIAKRWSKMDQQNIVKKAPASSGVYELKNFGNLVYIGRATDLQERLLTHNREKDPNRFRFKKAGWLGSPDRMERNHLARFEQKHGRLPSWNQRRE